MHTEYLPRERWNDLQNNFTDLNVNFQVYRHFRCLVNDIKRGTPSLRLIEQVGTVQISQGRS